MRNESNTNRFLSVTAGVFSIAAVGFLDYITGIELSFFLFYFFPVALFAWFVGRAPALLAALVCALVWYAVDAFSGHVYSHPALWIWNGALRWIAFSLVAVTLSRIRSDDLKERELNRRLSSTVEELRESLARIDALRNDVQIVCAWTNRIKSEGRWIKFEEFMKQHFQMRFTHGISAEGIKQLEAEEARALAEKATTPESTSHDPSEGTG